MALSDEEVLKLQKVVVRDNHKAKTVLLCSGYYGSGNSNTSGASYDRRQEYKLQELKDKPIEFIETLTDKDEQAAIAAIEDDTLVLILLYRNVIKEVKRYPLESRGFAQQGQIAYDTTGFFNLYLKP